MGDHFNFNIPTCLLHETDGFIVTIELKSGELYRGMLEASEDCMNCELSDVTYTNLDGVDSHLDRVFIRGSSILFIVIPDMFANDPIFLEPRSFKGAGEGYAGNLRDKKYASKIRSRFS